MDIEAAIGAVSTSGVGPERQRQGLDTVRKLLSNLVRSPAEEKYRQIKRSNPAIQSRLFPECYALLLAAGFQESGDLLIYLSDPSEELHEVLALVESLLLSLGDCVEGGSSSSTRPATNAAVSTPTPMQSKRQQLQKAQEKTKAESEKAQASAQEQLAALRKHRAGQYQSQQDEALARHLSSRDADEPYDAITALNVSRGATYGFVSCSRCGCSLRYNSSTRAQAVLCPCGTLLQPLHMRGQAFAPRSPSDLPVEPGEPVDTDSRPRATRGPLINVRGPNGESTRMPLHSVLQMVRQNEERQQTGAADDTIQALPTREFHREGTTSGADDEGRRCQICIEDFEEGDELRTLPCFHLFHAKCVDQWLKVNSVCPTCRHKVG
jgi:hypothetical protein